MDNKFTQEYIEYLAHNFKEGSLSPQERADFDAWYDLQLEKELDLSDTEIENEEQHRTRIYQIISNRIQVDAVQDSPKVYRLWPRIAIAAAVLIVIFVSTLWFYQNKGTLQNIAAIGDIKAGRSGGTLTLGNGEKIRLADNLTGRIAAQSGVVINKLDKGEIVYQVSGNRADRIEYNTLQTSRGEQAKVLLPDGSLVYLNAASSLRFPASFANMDRREVELSGEGYFEIAKDKNHPFIVKADLQKVEVLGTHFNLNSYGDEADLKTTLLEGSVRLTAGKINRTLLPGEQAVLKNSKVDIRKADIEQIVAWKNNEFIFRGDDFRTNMRKIARWYDIEVLYESDAPDNFMLGGFLSRSRNLSEVLSLLEKTDKVHFRRKGRKVYVSK